MKAQKPAFIPWELGIRERIAEISYLVHKNHHKSDIIWKIVSHFKTITAEAFGLAISFRVSDFSSCLSFSIYRWTILHLLLLAEVANFSSNYFYWQSTFKTFPFFYYCFDFNFLSASSNLRSKNIDVRVPWNLCSRLLRRLASNRETECTMYVSTYVHTWHV